MTKLFGDIIGQKRTVRVLDAHLGSGGLSHAYLFLGREGVGKEHLAKEFARYIICGSKKEDDCPSCTRFKRGIHPDFIYIDGSNGIKIDQVRGAIEKINLTPSASTKKVLLISNAENIGIEAANALLKTLEEPPADSVILITTKSEKRLPETIVSRAQVLRLSEIPESEIKKELLRNYSKEKVEAIISLSGGSIGSSIKLLESDEFKKHQENIRDDVQDFLSLDSTLERFMIIDKYEKSKKIKEFFDFLAKVIFKSLIFDFIEDNPAVLNNGQSRLSTERKKTMAEKILKNYRNLDYNVNLRIILEEMILEDSLNG
jgi:DNA polymerase-3 subunit delta'